MLSPCGLWPFPAAKKEGVVAKLRARHHTAARLLALGYRPGKVAALTGYCNSRISVLQTDPAFQDLIEFYKKKEDEEYDHVRGGFAEIVGDAVAELKARLEAEPDKIPLKDLLKLATEFGDRTGHGPQSTVKQVNIHANMAQMLEEGRKRAKDKAMEGRVIEGSAHGGGLVDPWVWIDRGAAFVTAALMLALWLHVSKCDKRSDRIWGRFDKLDDEIGGVQTDVATIKGEMRAQHPAKGE